MDGWMDGLIGFSFHSSLDAESVVSAYLSHITVSTKNTTGETFDMSLRVFVHKKQTLIIPQDATEPSLSFNDLRNRFRDLCSQYEQIKKNRLPEERYYLCSLIGYTS